MITILIFLTAYLVSCKKDFSNKASYNIRIGETFELYVSENSCCQNCWVDKTKLNSIELLNQKLVEPRDKDCDGCTSYYSWNFKGTNVGVDTIKIARICGGDNCSDYHADSSKIQPEIFIVTVSITETRH